MGCICKKNQLTSWAFPSHSLLSLNKGVVGTGAEEFQFPLTINSSITLIDIAEFDENKNTITLQVVLSIRWHAATMKLESNNDKYVFQFN